jgi:hypothetical protein
MTSSVEQEKLFTPFYVPHGSSFYVSTDYAEPGASIVFPKLTSVVIDVNFSEGRTAFDRRTVSSGGSSSSSTESKEDGDTSSTYETTDFTVKDKVRVLL